MIRPRRLGETEQAWYIRAKAAVAKFDGFADRSAESQGLADHVAGLVSRVEASSPADYSVFAGQDAKDAVSALEDVVRALENATSGGSLGQASSPSPWLCAAAGLIVVGTIAYFALKG